MRVLVLDAAPSIDGSALQFLHWGYEIAITRTPDEAFERMQQTEFDCILFEVSTSARCLGLARMRQLVRTSAVAFMTTVPVESLAAQAQQEGSIEFQSLPVLIENLKHFPRPVMLAGRDLPPALLAAAKNKQFRVSSARTLQFAMNLLADGWCQIVWLHAEIPGQAHPDKVAIVHQIGAKPLAILASALSGTTPGITCIRKPATAKEFIALLRHIADDRLAHCGRPEILAKPLHSSH